LLNSNLKVTNLPALTLPLVSSVISSVTNFDLIQRTDKAFSSFLRIPAAGFRNRATGGAILNTVSLAALWTRNASVSTGGVQEKMLSFCADVVPEVLDS
jgi:hypothetical protein